MPSVPPFVQNMATASAILSAVIGCIAMIFAARRAQSVRPLLLAAGFAYCFPKMVTLIFRDLTADPWSGLMEPLLLLIALLLLGWSLLRLARQIPAPAAPVWLPETTPPPPPATGNPPAPTTRQQP